jgi:protein-S-isoprenylcysteine O-methyltransferase Ste14
MSAFFRLTYSSFSIIIFIIYLFLFFTGPNEVLYTLQDMVSNTVFLILDTLRILFLVIMGEAIWEMGFWELIGMKQLIRHIKKQPNDQKNDRFRPSTYIPKGLYLRQRHPLMFYTIIYLISANPFTVKHLLSLIIFIAYYAVCALEQEQSLEEDMGKSYTTYKNAVPRFIPSFKKYESKQPD